MKGSLVSPIALAMACVAELVEDLLVTHGGRYLLILTPDRTTDPS